MFWEKSMSRIIIDVREPFEYTLSHVEGAVNIPVSKLFSGADDLKDVPKDTELILYCRSGSRAGVSVEVLQKMGYTNVKNGINMSYVSANHL